MFVKEGNEKRKTGEARHEHIQFAEVKRARDAVFDFGTHDYAFFAEVGSSVSSQGQQGSCSVPDVVDPGSGRFPQRFDPGWTDSGANLVLVRVALL